MAAPSPCSTTPRRDSYQRRRPDETLLYQLIEQHWPTFRERAERSGGLPDFIVEEFEAYLRCGMLEHGCGARFDTEPSSRLACARSKMPSSVR